MTCSSEPQNKSYKYSTKSLLRETIQTYAILFHILYNVLFLTDFVNLPYLRYEVLEHYK